MSPVVKGWHDSSTVLAVAYDAAAQQLTITFASGGYRLSEFPAEAFAAFDAAPSPGRHFQANIRGKYPSVKIEPEAA